MDWGCFAAAGPGQLAIVDKKMNSQVYHEILQENVRPSVCKLKSGDAIGQGYSLQEKQQNAFHRRHFT